MRRTGTSLINRSKVNIRATNSSHVASTNIDLKIRQDRFAREGNASDLSIVDGTLNTAVVCVDDRSRGEHERSSSISDGLATGRIHSGTGTDSKFGSGELPEATGGVDSCPLHGAVKLGSIDVAKLVGAGGVGAEIGGEDRGFELGDGVVEESFLLGWGDSVEFGERESKESVGLGVCDEGLGDGSWELDGLAGDLHSTNADDVSPDIS